MNEVISPDQRLRRAVRVLDDPPPGPGWNAAELADLLDPRAPRRSAAVLVPFVRRPAGLSVLFTRRTESLREHAGQVSFPGGRMEPRDAGPVATALRETREETGIQPTLIEPFGYLDCLDTVSGYRVTPVTAFVRDGYHLRLQASEVEDAFEVPFSFILTPANWRREEMDWRGKPREIFAFRWREQRVWGATAMILRNLIRRLEQST